MRFLALLLGYDLASIIAANQVILPDGTQLRGTIDEKSIAFKGIPFAAAPIDDLRWAPPQPWVNPDTTQVLDATEYGNICYQDSCYTDDSVPCSEDCLFLNVFVKKLPQDNEETTLLPVALYIYGGTYVVGSSNDLDGGELMSYWGSNSGILVTMNYRLNVFGFLGSDKLRELDIDDGSTGNYGIQDQRMAMKWIQENIEAFGGDPTQISLFGESAGAGSITQHLSRPKSWNHFSAAAMESGSFSVWSAVNMTVAEFFFNEVSKNVGCSSDENTLTCLQNKSTVDLYLAGTAVTEDPDGPYLLSIGPTIDGIEATTHPWISLSQGLVADKPILYGFNRDEGVAFTTLNPNATLEDVEEFWTEMGFVSDDELATLSSLYLENVQYPEDPQGYSDYWWAGVRSLGDMDFSCPARYTSQTLAAFPDRVSFNQTFVYYFTHVTDGAYFVKHTYELAYVYHLFNELLITVNDQDMSKVVDDFWGSFFFDPNNNPNNLHFGDQKTESVWPTYTIEGDEIIDLSNASSVHVVNGLKKPECDFLIPYLDAVVRSNFDPV